jgi:hypothetical protein
MVRVCNKKLWQKKFTEKRSLCAMPYKSYTHKFTVDFVRKA